MFKLEPEQLEEISKWMEAQDAAVAAKQGKDHPYYGCSGGSYTYHFTPTTLGLVVKVTNNLTKEEIDVTDYHMW